MGFLPIAILVTAIWAAFRDDSPPPMVLDPYLDYVDDNDYATRPGSPWLRSDN